MKGQNQSEDVKLRIGNPVGSHVQSLAHFKRDIYLARGRK